MSALYYCDLKKFRDSITRAIAQINKENILCNTKLVFDGTHYTIRNSSLCDTLFYFNWNTERFERLKS